jgi:hypothetical protein
LVNVFYSGQMYHPELKELLRAFETKPTLVVTLQELLVQPNRGTEVIRQSLANQVMGEGVRVEAAFLDQFIKDLSSADAKKQGQTHMELTLLSREASRILARNKQAQERLKAAGFAPGPTDGIIGHRTRAALSAFQRDRRLPVTGSLDWVTREALGVFSKSLIDIPELRVEINP